MASLEKRNKNLYRLRWIENGERKQKTFNADSYKDALDRKNQKEDELRRMKSSSLRLSELWHLYKQARPRRNNEKHEEAFIKRAIEFIDHVENKFPFRIHTIRTDRGHEFQARFHWHVEDKGVRHIYIKPRSPQLNGKVERSHSTDQREFYQLLTYTDDVDLNKKLESWEWFYNFHRPHGAFEGKTPYETLRSLLT